MKLFIAFALVIVVVYATPQGRQEEVVLVKETPSDNIGLGGYRYAYELSNGQSHQEVAELVNEGTENEALTVRGSYSWVEPQSNTVYTVNYVADENGFHPVEMYIKINLIHIPTYSLYPYLTQDFSFESAEVIEGGTDGQFLRVRGTFSFVDPQTNIAYTVNYIADDTGFHPQGEHLPRV
ncbi:Flexible cuticle protein [Apis cerana cerana]|uniref:Flexible cuticle protein n=1 Tax=Apis cerana cerana TaxID=94128 RepID=A0A2A3EQL2_APICC|nr:Flexible cuticle protein [Apis cerana cerana]